MEGIRGTLGIGEEETCGGRDWTEKGKTCSWKITSLDIKIEWVVRSSNL